MGTIAYGENEDEVFLGRSNNKTATHMSEETAKKVDAEVKKIINTSYERAKNSFNRKNR